MLDIKYIAEHPEEIKDGLAKKGYTKEMLDVDALIALYRDIAKLKTSSQALSEEKNKLSNSIKSASAEDRPAIIAKKQIRRRRAEGRAGKSWLPSRPNLMT